MLQDKQYQVGDVVFGADCPIKINGQDGWTPGSAALRTQDTENPGRDGVRVGRDFKGASTWGFSLYTDRDSEIAAWEAYNDFLRVWDDEDLRLEAGRVTELRFCLGDKERLLYGRPRRCTPVPTNLILSGRLDIEADFMAVDHRFYDSELKSKTVSIGTPLELDAGLVVPFIPPFSTSAGATVKQSSITIGGQLRTPIMVKITGPIEGASVKIGDWTAAPLDPVTANNPVTFDARPWVVSATQANGGGIRVSPRVTRVSEMWLPPGTHQVVFTGYDQTSQANVLVSWRDAYRTPR